MAEDIDWRLAGQDSTFGSMRRATKRGLGSDLPGEGREGRLMLDAARPRDAQFDATRVEHRVIDGRLPAVYDATIHADFLEVWRRSWIIRGLFGLRAVGERAAAAARGSQYVRPPESAALLLSDLPEHGDWVRLGEDPPNEFV